MGKTWTPEEMEQYLAKAPAKAIGLALVRIFERQTADEQASERTSVQNGQGFSGYDAKTGTYMAQWVLSGRELSGQYLERGRKMAMRYRKQLVEVANAK